MSDVTQPVARIDLGAGYVAPVKILFAADRSEVCIGHRGMAHGLGAWLTDRVPDVAGVILVVAAAALFVALWRVLRRPLVRGRWHCRRCSYDLGPDTHRPEVLRERCPECGAASTGRGVVRGCSRGARLAVPVAASLLAIAVSFGTLAATLVPFGGPAPPTRVGPRPWPGGWMASVSPRLVFRRRSDGASYRIERFSLPEGEFAGEVATFRDASVARIVHSGEGMTLAVHPVSPRRAADVISIIDLRTRFRRTVEMDIDDVRWRFELSADGHSIFVQSSRSGLNGRRTRTFERIEIGCLNRAVIAEMDGVDVSMSDGSVQRYDAPLHFLALPQAEGDKTVPWASVAVVNVPLGPGVVGGYALAAVTVQDQRGRRTFTVPLPATAIWHIPRVSADGAAILIPAVATSGGLAGVSGSLLGVRIDLATGASTVIGSGLGTDKTVDGAFMLSPAGSGTHRLIRTSDQSVIATVAASVPAGGPGLFGHPVISGDGRWLAQAMVESESLAAGLSGPPRTVVYTWPLDPPAERWQRTPSNASPPPIE